jgi:hypothetical protein
MATLLWFPTPAAAQGVGPVNPNAPTQHVKPEQGKDENADDHDLPIQAYYYRAFFGQPWRQPDEYKQVFALTGALLVINVGVWAALRVRRGRIA